MKSLETQLSNWTPRPPSPEVARALFSKRLRPRPQVYRPGRTWAWLAPALGVFAIATILQSFSPNAGAERVGYASGDTPSASMLACLNGKPIKGWNVVLNIFEWTNQGAMHSSSGSFLLYSTNVIKD